jgi:malonate transporter and related proteins
MIPVVTALIPIFLLIMMGFCLRRWLIAEDAHWVGVEHLLYYVMFPVLLISTMAHADLTQVPVLLVAIAMFGSVLIVSVLCFALKPLFERCFGVDGPAFSSFFQGATRWQTFIALPLAENLYGTRGLALASVALVAMTPLLNVLSVSVTVRYAAGAKADWRTVLVAVMRNPLIWACAVGAVLNPVANYIPQPIDVLMDALGRSSLALGLLIVGAGLRIDELRHLQPLTLPSAALKLVVMPATTTALAKAVGLSGTTLAVMMCCMAVPVASNSYVLARQLGGDAPLMAQIIMVQTAIAAITLPIAISLLT